MHTFTKKFRAILDDFSEDTCQTVLVACEEALKALERRLLGSAEDEHEEEVAEGGLDAEGAADPDLIATLTRTRVRSSAKVEEALQTDFSYAVTAARRSEQRRLLSFVRMVDFVVQESLRGASF